MAALSAVALGDFIRSAPAVQKALKRKVVSSESFVDSVGNTEEKDIHIFDRKSTKECQLKLSDAVNTAWILATANDKVIAN